MTTISASEPSLPPASPLGPPRSHMRPDKPTSPRVPPPSTPAAVPSRSSSEDVSGALLAMLDGSLPTPTTADSATIFSAKALHHEAAATSAASTLDKLKALESGEDSLMEPAPSQTGAPDLAKHSPLFAAAAWLASHSAEAPAPLPPPPSQPSQPEAAPKPARRSLSMLGGLFRRAASLTHSGAAGLSRADSLGVVASGGSASAQARSRREGTAHSRTSSLDGEPRPASGEGEGGSGGGEEVASPALLDGSEGVCASPSQLLPLMAGCEGLGGGGSQALLPLPSNSHSLLHLPSSSHSLLPLPQTSHSLLPASRSHPSSPAPGAEAAEETRRGHRRGRSFSSFLKIRNPLKRLPSDLDSEALARLQEPSTPTQEAAGGLGDAISGPASRTATPRLGPLLPVSGAGPVGASRSATGLASPSSGLSCFGLGSQRAEEPEVVTYSGSLVPSLGRTQRLVASPSLNPLAQASDMGVGVEPGSAPGLLGLRNIGNTCFVSAAVQCLRCTPTFTGALGPAWVVPGGRDGGGFDEAATERGTGAEEAAKERNADAEEATKERGAEESATEMNAAADALEAPLPSPASASRPPALDLSCVRGGVLPFLGAPGLACDRANEASAVQGAALGDVPQARCEASAGASPRAPGPASPSPLGPASPAAAEPSKLSSVSQSPSPALGIGLSAAESPEGSPFAAGLMPASLAVTPVQPLQQALAAQQGEALEQRAASSPRLAEALSPRPAAAAPSQPTPGLASGAASPDRTPAPPSQPPRGTMLGAFAQTVRSFYPPSPATLCPGSRSVDPVGLLRAIKAFPDSSHLLDGGQHDCQEVLRVLLDKLHDDLNRAPRSDAAAQAAEEASAPGSSASAPSEGSLASRGAAPESGGFASDAAASSSAGPGPSPLGPAPPPPPPRCARSAERAKADAEWTRYMEREQSAVTSLFGGQLQSSVECHRCQRRFTTYEPFWDLSLPMAKEPKAGGLNWLGLRPSQPTTLHDCLKLFAADERLEGEEAFCCEVCGERTPATKRLRVYRQPRILVLHMKRFKYRGTSTDKLSTAVSFPLADLSLADFVSEEVGVGGGGEPAGLAVDAGCLHGPVAEEGGLAEALDRPEVSLGSASSPADSMTALPCSPLSVEQPASPSLSYDLYAVSNHYGSLAGGHYTAACRVPSGLGAAPGEAWYSFNDDVVTRVTPEQVVSPSAYMLFYVRRDVQRAAHA